MEKFLDKFLKTQKKWVRFFLLLFQRNNSQSFLKFPTLLSLILFLTLVSVQLSGQCVTTSSFLWDNGSGSGQTWIESDFTRVYTDVGGSGVNVTLQLTDNDGQNCDLGNPSGFGDYTETTGGFGNNVLTYQMTSGNSNQIVEFKFTFSKPVFMDAFEIFDIDYNGNGTALETFQDEIAFSSNNAGVNVPITIGQHPSATASIVGINGQTAAANYAAGVSGNVGHTDPNGAVLVSVSSPITEFIIQYSNGPSDDGQSDDHAVSVSGFTFCEVPPDNDNDGIPDITDIDDDNDGITDAQELCGTDPVTPSTSAINISINLDGFPGETTWTLNSPSEQVASGGPYGIGNTTVNETVNVSENGNYTFTIFDSYGDGLLGNTYTVSGSDFTTITTPFNDQGLANTQISQTENFSITSASSSAFSCLSSDPSSDNDNDGTLNYQDADFCTLNANGVCTNMDTDGDGIIDPFDTDSDNDGCYDAEEAGHGEAMETDNSIVASSAEVGNNGLDTSVENNDTGTSGLNYTIDETNSGTYDFQSNTVSTACTPPPDIDGDGVADVDDLDNDNDGILDLDEGYVPCPELTPNSFDPELLQAAYHATLIKTGEDWIISGSKLDGTGGDQLTFDYMSNIYSYPDGAIPAKVTVGGVSTVVVLMTNGEFYTAGRMGDTNIGIVLASASRPTGESWGLSTLTLPSGVTAADVKTMRAAGNMLMIITNAGIAYVVGQHVDTQLDGTFSQTSFNQITMPVGITVKDAHIAENSMFILGSDNNFYRYGINTFDGDGSGSASISGTADLMTQPSLGGDLVQFELGNRGSYLILDSNGDIHVLGNNSNGQIGIGSTTDQTTWTTIPGVTGVKYISAGRRSRHQSSAVTFYSAFIGSDDKVYVFGHNNFNAITNAAPNYGDQTTPVLASGVNADAISVVAGGHITPYINSSFDIMNTGHNDGGAFGDGTTTDRSEYSGTSIAQILGAPVVVGCTSAGVDTDGDGIPDYLEIDSDNDGCPDAIEGAGNFTMADIQNDTLTGGVDEDGIPTVVTASGQAIGTSQDSTQQAAACLTIAENDINQTPQDVNVSGNILTNDSDPTDDAQTVQSASFLNAIGVETNLPFGAATDVYDEAGTLAGSIILNTDGTYEFTPATGYTGTVPVDYVVVDSNGSTDTAILTIEVLPIPSTDGGNNDVIAQDDTNTTEQGATVTTPILANDSDPDGDALSIIGAFGFDMNGDSIALTTTPQNVYDENGVLAGQASIDGSGNVIFTADNDFAGEVPIEYTATDGTDSDDATLVITVEPSNPDNDTYANDDASTGLQDVDQTGNILTNDNDPEAETQSIASILVDTNGDGTATSVTPVAGAPTDIYEDIDGNGTPELIGTIDLDPATGAFTFNPESDFVGTADIPYTAADNNGATDTATLYLTTLPSNATVAENDINQTPQDVAVGGNVLTNDTDEQGDTQTVQSATFLNAAGMVTNLPLSTATDIYDEAGTLAGSITLNADGTYDFTPANGYTGIVPIEYITVDDNDNQATDAATLTIEVLPTPSNDGSNNDVIAQDDTNTAEQGATVTTPILANDSDPDDDVLSLVGAFGFDMNGDSIALTTTPQNVYDENSVLAGQASIDGSGNVIFTADNDFAGDVPIEYTATDGTDTDDATLIITVDPANPDNDTYANDDASTGLQDVDQTGNILTNDNDPEAETQSITSILVDTNGDGTATSVTPVAGIPTNIYEDIDGNGTPELIGTIDLDPATGAFTFNPEPDFIGTADIPYTATDGADTDDATLYLTILPSSNTIASEDDFNNTPFETPVSADVSTNDVDQEGDNQTFTLDGANGGMDSADGSVTLNSDGSYTYTPAIGFSGETSFEYSTCDDGAPALCDTSTVFLEVFPQVNPETPQVFANPDANTVESGQTGTGNVMSNDLDPDGLDPAVTTTLTAQTVVGVDEDGNLVADAGTLTLNSDGSYSFIPTGNFTGTVTQPYTICNAEAPAVCDDTQLIIDVIPDDSNTTFANDDAEVTDAGVTVTNNVATNDTDSEMDAQAITDFLVDTDGDGKGDTPGTVGTSTILGGTNDMGAFVANAGEITLNSDGSYSFTPAPGFVGNVNVPYTTCDDATNMACEDATLVISVLDVKRDYGDAPVTYPAVWHRAVTDTDDDNVLDGTTDVWLGMNTSFESAQQSSPTGTGDQYDDAISFGASAGQFPLLAEPGATYNVDIIVNSAQADLVFYGMWIDWDEDGVYDDFHTGSRVTASPATATVTITAPATVGSAVNVRLRADDDPFVTTDFEGGKTNGEVEDFQALVVLPVTLTHFSGQAAGCNTDLRWHAETEENFSHYDIERSGDGRLFNKIETIKGTGNTNTSIWYNYTDKAASQFNYYRLKMVDLDGSTEYSKVINVDTDCTNDYKIELFPNPTSSNLGVINVKFYSKSDEAQIQIVDMQGRTVKRLSIGTVRENLNSIQLDVTDLAPGSYHLNMIGGGKGSSKIFIITNE